MGMGTEEDKTQMKTPRAIIHGTSRKQEDEECKFCLFSLTKLVFVPSASELRCSLTLDLVGLFLVR